MKNPCINVALRELADVGIRDVAIVHGGKHPQLRWKVNGHGMRVYSVPGSPSDVRSAHNTRADIRRMLRADGFITTPERTEASSPPPRKPDRLSILEQRVTALERAIAELKPI